MRTFTLLLFSLLCCISVTAQPSKKDIKAAKESLELGKRHMAGATTNLDAYKNAIYEFGYALRLMQGDMPEAALLYARSVILNYGSPKSYTYTQLGYFPFYKEDARVKEVDKVYSVLRPFLQRDSTKADPYLALAMVNMLCYTNEPARYQPYFQKVISLGNADPECMEAYNRCYKKMVVDELYSNFDKANKEKNEKLVMELAAKIRSIESPGPVVYSFLARTYSEYGHYDAALKYADSISNTESKYLETIKYICDKLADPKEKFRIMYPRVVHSRKNFLTPVQPYLFHNLLEYAGKIENQPEIDFPYTDSLSFFRYTETAYAKAKAGNYYSALVWYSAGFDHVINHRDHHAFIGYHYNKALALALLNDDVYRGLALECLDSAVKIYSSDAAVTQLTALRKKINAKEKLVPEGFMAKPAYHDELVAQMLADYRAEIARHVIAANNKIDTPPAADENCIAPVFNNSYLEKMNKQAQNDINNWNSVTKNGQLYRESPNAKTAISRIGSTYSEIAGYYRGIYDEATRKRARCTDKAKQAELDRVAGIAKSMMENCNAQISKWNGAN